MVTELCYSMPATRAERATNRPGEVRGGISSDRYLRVNFGGGEREEDTIVARHL